MTGPSDPTGDEFTDDELRALLHHIIRVIHDGDEPPDTDARIENALRNRRETH